MPRTSTNRPDGIDDLVVALPEDEIQKYVQGMIALMGAESVPSQRNERRKDKATFRLRVDLMGAKPPIWRRLLVPSDLGLRELHRVLQIAMGWSGGTMHRFSKGASRNDPHAERYVSAPEFVAPGAVFEGEVRLDELLAVEGDKLFYEYDLGEGWSHVIRLEAVEAPIADQRQIRCIAGRRACPPERCGGMDAYRELVALTKVPTDELGLADLGRLRYHRPYAEWSPDSFDVAAIDAAIDEALEASVA